MKKKKNTLLFVAVVFFLLLTVNPVFAGGAEHDIILP